MIYKSAAELIGKTPMLELTNFEKKEKIDAKIIAKLEYFNNSPFPYRDLHMMSMAKGYLSISIVLQHRSGKNTEVQTEIHTDFLPHPQLV